MTFEEYLISKKIDAVVFNSAEGNLFTTWKVEFEQMHPASFTAQKLYLINPIRRKYLLAVPDVKANASLTDTVVSIPVDKVNIESTPLTLAPLVDSTPQANDGNADENKPLPAKAKPARPVFKPKPKID